MSKQIDRVSRRTFIRRSAVATAALQIVPGSVLGLNGQTPPSRKLNVAGIGVGGMGGSNIKKCVEAGHEKNWLQAIKDGKPAISNFDYSGPFAEMVLLGNLAVRFPERRLLWDGDAMKVTNDTDAQAFVSRKYREGWTL